MNQLNLIKDVYAQIPEHDKETLKFAGQYVAGRVLFNVIRTGLLYHFGKKLAPNLFTSFGRTYLISYVARLAVKEASLTEDQKERLKNLKEKQKQAKLDKYHQSAEFAAALRRHSGTQDNE